MPIRLSISFEENRTVSIDVNTLLVALKDALLALTVSTKLNLPSQRFFQGS